jgi:hypothetical protein
MIRQPRGRKGAESIILAFRIWGRFSNTFMFTGSYRTIFLVKKSEGIVSNGKILRMPLVLLAEFGGKGLSGTAADGKWRMVE